MRIFELNFTYSGIKSHGRTTNSRRVKEITAYINVEDIKDAMAIMERRYVVCRFMSVKELCYIVEEENYEY